MIDEKELLLTIKNMAARIRHLETLTTGYPAIEVLLLETGDFLLLEDGSDMLLE